MFELSLVPIVVLIMGWGIQPERVSAIYHLFVYTFIFSSPFLVGAVFCRDGFSFRGNFLLSFIMSIALIVKLPLYLLHV